MGLGVKTGVGGMNDIDEQVETDDVEGLREFGIDRESYYTFGIGQKLHMKQE
jgi:hypothetical protein